MPNKLSVAESRVLESIQGAAFDVPGVIPTARGLSHWGEHALGWMGSAAVGAGGGQKNQKKKDRQKKNPAKKQNTEK